MLGPVVILGASRGLGRTLSDELAKRDLGPALLVARKLDRLESMASEYASRPSVLKFDLTREDQWPNLLAELSSKKIETVLCVAGGGPYGPVESKAWKDHDWALQLNYRFPAYLIHAILRGGLPSARKVLVVGSAIAEQTPERAGASYCAAKRAIKGWIESVQLELAARPTSGPALDLRLYSPGYMDTELLTPNAWPRQHGQKILAVGDVASDLLTWLVDSQFAGQNRTFGI